MTANVMMVLLLAPLIAGLWVIVLAAGVCAWRDFKDGRL